MLKHAQYWACLDLIFRNWANDFHAILYMCTQMIHKIMQTYKHQLAKCLKAPLLNTALQQAFYAIQIVYEIETFAFWQLLHVGFWRNIQQHNNKYKNVAHWNTTDSRKCSIV